MQRECGLAVSTEEAVAACNWGLAEVVYEWARGTVRSPPAHACLRIELDRVANEIVCDLVCERMVM